MNNPEAEPRDILPLIAPSHTKIYLVLIREIRGY